MPLVFQNPAALWALPLTAVPLLVHLWSRRRFEEEPWGAMEFLLRAMAARARRIWLEEWLLLAFRTLAMLLLVVAFADPRLATSQATTPETPRTATTLHVFVLDGSYSMQRTADGKSAWEEAVAYARTVVESSQVGDGFMALLMAEDPEWLIRDVSHSSTAVLAAIEDARPVDAPADLLPTLEVVQQRLAEVRRRADFSQTIVHWVSDLQEVTWKSVQSDAVQTAVRRLATSATMVVHPIALPVRVNHYCASLEATPPSPFTGEPVTLTAEIINDGPRTSTVSVSFVSAQRLIDRRSVTLAAGASESVSVTTSWDRAGEIPWEVRLSDDGLAVDNHRRRIIPVRDRMTVVCLEGRPGAARWIRLALEASPDRFQVRTAPWSELARELEKDADVAFLVNPDFRRDDELTQIRHALERGVGIVLAWGDRFDAQWWKRRSLPEWLPAIPQELAKAGEAAVDPLEYAHPIVAPFRGNERSGLRSLPIWQYVRVKPAPGSRVALALDNGDPLIVERRVGAGPFVLVAMPLEMQSVDPTEKPPVPWSALPIWPSFVPLVQQMARTAGEGRALAREFVVGQPLRGRWPDRETVSDPVMILPNGRRSRLELASVPPWWIWKGPASSSSGWARLERNPRQPVDFVAINVDTRESRLAAIAPSRLPEPWQVRRTWQPPAIAPPPSPGTLFRTFLVGVLGLLIAESLLRRARATRGE